MAAYIVTYDLMQQGQNYTCITNKLRAYGTWCHLQGSVWIIVTELNAVQVRDDLRSCLDHNDKLFVCRLARDAAWVGHGQQTSDWLQRNL